MYLNKALIVGNLTRDPELRAMPSGGQVASMSVATNSVWKDRDGTKKEDVQFHNIVVFGNQAGSCAQYLKKGQSVLIEGRLQTRSWEDKTSGEKKYRTEIIADRVQFGYKSTSGGPENASQGADEAVVDADTGEVVLKTPLSKKTAKVASVDRIEYPTEDINPEDIPF